MNVPQWLLPPEPELTGKVRKIDRWDAVGRQGQMIKYQGVIYASHTHAMQALRIGHPRLVEMLRSGLAEHVG